MKILRRLHIQGYRSLVDLDLRLAPVTVVTGPNGVGKSNLYQALRLVAAVADGRFAEAIAGEGGMPSVLWAGSVPGKPKRKEVRVRLIHDEFEYELGYGLAIDSGGGSFTIEWHSPDLNRPLSGRELSDGTLRFVALAAALLSPQPASLLVLNEPEASLNPGLFPALARLIAHAAERSQVLLVTHAGRLAGELEALTEVRHHELAMVLGATRKKSDGTARRVWSFEEEDE